MVPRVLPAIAGAKWRRPVGNGAEAGDLASIISNPGFDHVYLGVYFSGESNAQVLYWIQFQEGETTDRVFEALYEHEDSINAELGLPDDSPCGVWWDPRRTRRYALVHVTREQWDARGEAAHDEIREWMAEYLEKFDRVFKPLLEAVGEETGVWNE